MAAACALGNISDKRALDPLIEALEDKYWNVKQAAATALGHLGDKRAIRALIRALGEDEYGFARLAASSALSKLGEKKWANIVKGESEDFERLGSSGDRRALEPLIKALGDRKPDIRIRAALALGNLSDTRATEILCKTYDNDTNKNVKNAIAKTLKRLQGE